MDEFEEYYALMAGLKLGDKDNDAVTCSQETCVGCGKSTLYLDNDNGTIVCTTCGIVNDSSMISTAAEWTFSDDGKDPSRCGCPINPLLEKSSMSTMIGKGGGTKFWLMKKIHQQNSMDYVERARWHVFEKIAHMCDQANLPNTVVNLAKQYYKIISEKKLSRGGVRKGIIACCIMYACRTFNVSRSVKEIAKICELDTSKINNASKIFESLMQDHLCTDQVNNVHDEVRCVQTDDLVLRFCCSLNLERHLTHRIVREVKVIAAAVDSLGLLIGKTPSASTSAMILYVMQQQSIPVNKKEIVSQHGVSLVTLNKILAILEKHRDEISQFI